MTKTAGEYRNDIYKVMEGIMGKEMSEKEHAFVKAVLLEYVREHGRQMSPQPPMKHEITCPKCLGVRTLVGKRLKEYKKKIKIAVKNNIPLEEPTN